MAGLARVLFFYQPLVWWLRRQLRLCQDYVADASASRQASQPEDYAEFLTARAAAGLLHPAMVGLGMGFSKSELYRRVVMLVQNRPLEIRPPRLWNTLVNLVALVLIGILSALSLTSESAAQFTPESAAKTEGKAPQRRSSDLKKVAFVIGPNKFAKGDKIVIEEVWSKLGSLEVGDTVTVKGTYTLTSHYIATLLFSITQDASRGFQGGCTLERPIRAGTAPFELELPVAVYGHLHIGFYDAHSSFGNVYFGTYEQMQEIAHWDLEKWTNAGRQRPAISRRSTGSTRGTPLYEQEKVPQRKSFNLKKVDFVIGPQAFANGDKIVIEEVRSKLGSLAVGDTVSVKGTCTLASHSTGTLLLSITQDARSPQGGTAIERPIRAGTVPFEYERPIEVEGHLHLGFYDNDSGSCFGTVYFGTYEQMKEIAHWNVEDWTDNDRRRTDTFPPNTGEVRGTPAGKPRVSASVDERKEAETRAEMVVGVRPEGSCSIRGKVVSEATGKPIAGARMYLFYLKTYASIFVNTDSNGVFIFKDIPTGPFSLQVSHTAGYQDAIYNPEGQPGQFPQFSLKDGEQRFGIVLKAKPACRISGKVLDENGQVPDNIDTLHVLAWFKDNDGKKYKNDQAQVNRHNGSYLIDGLSERPAYVMAIDWREAAEGDAPPPIYYPSTFFRSDAKLITFDKTRSVNDVNITLRKEGGLIFEGTVRDDAGNAVPDAFVVIHHRDMLFDFATAYTDQQGHYQIQGLGDGEFTVHVDAVQRGLVRTRAPIDLSKATKKTQKDFALTRGVSISGKLVDEQGGTWQIGQSHGYGITVIPEEERKKRQSQGSFTLTGFGNKFRARDTRRASGTAFSLGDGNYYDNAQMLFPTKSTFIIQGLMPAHTMLGFSPQKEKQKVVKILYDGRDIMKSGIDTKPGQEIKDVTIVIGTDRMNVVPAADAQHADKTPSNGRPHQQR